MGIIAEKIDKFKYNWNLAAYPEDEQSIKKGKDFEEFVGSTLFSFDFDVSNRAADVFKTKIHGSYLKAKYPFDFEITHKKTQEVFAIECKWRNDFRYIEAFDTTVLYVTKDKEQLEKYKKFSYDLHVPVFIVVGVGGTPEKPKFLYSFPLSRLTYPTIFERICEKYRRPVDKKFYWTNGMLL